MNISEALFSAAGRLELVGVAEPRREAASLLKFVIKRDAAFLVAHPEHELTPDEVSSFQNAVARREKREPFQYIVGVQEFYGLEFEVRPDVLIPRPETEILVDAAINFLHPLEQPRCFEVGVGSGCISISIFHMLPTATGVGVDISEDAIELTRVNSVKHDVSDRLEIRKADLFYGTTGVFDLIVSNPPYIPVSDAETIQPEVGRFEPSIALFSGADGLDVIRRLIADSRRFLKPGGALMMEIGFGQADAVSQLLDDNFWKAPKFLDDLQGIPRTVTARLRA